jgi:hypothetical protein
MGYAWSLHGLRVEATTDEGLKFRVRTDGIRFAQKNLAKFDDVRVIGKALSLHGAVSSVAEAPRAVIVYSNPLRVPLSTDRVIETTYLGKRTRFVREAAGHEFEAGGLKLQVTLSRNPKELEILALVGEGRFGHPHVEHLLVEPFRALNGSNHFPRYLLREFGDGSGQLSIVAQDRHRSPTGGAAAAFDLQTPESYWGYFAKYIEFVGRDSASRDYAEPHAITLYHEQANSAVESGSAWIASLALCSAVEGLCKRHPSWQVAPSPVTTDERTNAETALASISSKFVQEQLRSALRRACEPQRPAGTPSLKALIAEGVIETRHRKAWETFRHRVAHGELLDPWGEDPKLEVFPDLHELLHLLTAHFIGFPVSPVSVMATTRRELEKFGRGEG